MSRHWDNTLDGYYTLAAGSCGPANAGHTILGLMKPASTVNGALLSLMSGTTNVAQIISDTGKWFGTGDFSGFGTVTIGAFVWIAQTKAPGTNVYRWHTLAYAADPATTTHLDGTGTHANGGAAIDSIRFGRGDNRAVGDIAVGAVWAGIALSDAAVQACFTLAAADIAALSPSGLWLLPQADFALNVTDATGNGADQTAVTGAASITASPDPPGYSWALGNPQGIWGVPI